MARITNMGRGREQAWTDTKVGRGCRSGSVAAAAGFRSRAWRSSRWIDDRGRATGSALILVLVCLVMMVLLGTAYVQVARGGRRSTRQLTNVDNLATVRDAVIAYMAKVLKEDLMDASGNFFSPAAYDESYDYPHTNATVTYQVKSGRPSTAGTVIGDAVGGRFDDTWLASTYVDMESRDYPTWPHLSNLNGHYLLIPKPGNPQKEPLETVTDATGYGTKPMRGDGLGEVFVYGNEYDYPVYTHPINFTNPNCIDFEYNGNYYPYGTDADGDGIVDARWTWAPDEVRQIGGTAYVVAYRIIDLSSMVNVNVATAATADGTTAPTAATAPRGYFPSDLDFSRLFSNAVNGSGGGGWPAESNGTAASILKTRTLSTVTNPSPVPSPAGDATLTNTDGLATFSNVAPYVNSRARAWNDIARYYGFKDARYDLSSELELRSRGGLNTSTDAAIELDAPNLFRKNANSTTELKFNNVPNISGGDRGVHAYMSGYAYSLNEGYDIVHDYRWFPNVRHMVTTNSAAAVLAPQYTGMSGAMDRLQYDLVYRRQPIGGAARLTAQQSATEIAERLAKIMKLGDPMYGGLNDATLVEQIATEFAVNITDYADYDNTPTGVASGGATYYGLEVMPFLREFYVQAGYESDMPDDPPTKYTKWKLVPGSGAFVIEIGNPFDKLCSMAGGGAGVSLRIVVRKEGQAAALVTYDVPTTVQSLPPRDPAGAETTDQMVFFSDPATPITESGGAKANVITDLGIDTVLTDGGRRVDVGVKLPDSAFDGSPLTAELQIEVSSGVFITYDRLRHADMKLPADYTQDHGDGMTPKQAHGQISLKRDGQKHRYLSNRGKSVFKHDPAIDSYVTNSTGVSAPSLGNDTKGVTGDTNLDSMQLAHANHQIFNVAELGYIFMYGFFDGDLGDFPSRLSGKDGDKDVTTTTAATDTASSIRQFLSYKNASNQAIVATTTKLPHMCMIMDQFTTLSPRWDGLDNDDEDQNAAYNAVDNEAEQAVAGRMNVNTTPAWLLALTSPMPETPQVLTEFYSAITQYRDRPGSRATITSDATVTTSGLPVDQFSDKGIRSIGELLMIRRRLDKGQTNDHKMTYYGEDGTALSATDPKRHYPAYDDLSTTRGTKRYPNEEFKAQENMARFQYLTNSLTTRSDRYCAYVVIRGYNAGDFTTAPTDTLRFFVLLDRAGVVNADSQIGVYPKTGQKN